jgi:hypothetical protein
MHMRTQHAPQSPVAVNAQRVFIEAQTKPCSRAIEAGTEVADEASTEVINEANIEVTSEANSEVKNEACKRSEPTCRNEAITKCSISTKRSHDRRLNEDATEAVTEAKNEAVSMSASEGRGEAFIEACNEGGARARTKPLHEAVIDAFPTFSRRFFRRFFRRFLRHFCDTFATLLRHFCDTFATLFATFLRRFFRSVSEAQKASVLYPQYEGKSSPEEVPR